MPYLMALLPGMFYMFVVSAYILNAQIGSRLPWAASYIGAGVLSFVYGAVLVKFGKKNTAIKTPEKE